MYRKSACMCHIPAFSWDVAKFTKLSTIKNTYFISFLYYEVSWILLTFDDVIVDKIDQATIEDYYAMV